MVNEWVLHDLMGENGPVAQGHVARLLVKLLESPDRISVMANSPWTSKAWQLMRFNDPYISELSRILHLGILRDSSRCTLIYEHEIVPLSDDLVAQIPPSDLYLVQTYKTTNADTLATSDRKLMGRLAPFPEIHTVERAAFLRDYAGCTNVIEYDDSTEA